ncbi:hypothetical protein EDC04DRAFT_2603923 [Pisolithus marmoratus]|nr:hypothetical protein EDC04DRAFT_2603923 [Pisolithus marmoratus]
MSQNVTNTDWTTVLDKAIQLASKDDQETANAKYAEHQCQKQVKKEHKAAEEAVACERVAQAEAEHQEEEAHKVAWEREEHAYAVDSETKFYEVLLNQQQAEEDWMMNRWSKTPVGTRPRMSALVENRLRASAPVGDRPGMSVLVPAESENPGPAESLRAKGQGKAHDPVSKHGKKSFDQCLGLKEQCVLPGAEKKKKQGAKEAMPPRADWHTSEMAKHQEIAKQMQHVQRQLNSHLYDLLQETKYQQIAEVEESSDKESTSGETSDRETDEIVEGEEAPESDPEE